MRSATRNLYPVACAVAVISLAGGIGATDATLTIRDVVFRRPPALYRAPDHLSKVQVGSPDRPITPLGNRVPGPLYAVWRNASLGGSLATATPERVRDVRTADRAEAARIRSVTPDFFAVLGVDAALGTLFTGVVSGIGPALLETHRLHGNPMRAMSSSDRVRQRWRHALVVIEIAVTVALLVVTATMLDSYRRNFTVDVGYRTQPLLMMRVENGGGVQTKRILDALKQMPGVASAAASTTVPYLASAPLQRVSADAAGSQTIRAERAGSVFDPDWPAFVVPVAIILVVGALATWIPSRRALKINPAVLLRMT